MHASQTQPLRWRNAARPSGFTLLELLVVITILALLAGLLIPSLSRARDRSKVAKCASNLRQIYQAFTMYMQDTDEVIFWKGPDVSLDGMDWYVYGGRETNNPFTGQENLFNEIIPRPLNSYVQNKIEIFHCPADDKPLPWAGGYSHFAWVGNSYNFNANGAPYGTNFVTGGLDAIRLSAIGDPSKTVLFLDASLVKATNYWHPGGKANVCFADGRVAFMQQPSTPYGEEWTWDP
ncbi:MAG: type II secretion system protein [Verrucomicrobia bacterium]|nr:type II secretion system protein [Verrucomicrobiota bacterium]